MRILTAGYGNRGFVGFIGLLQGNGVTHLVDVRSVPQSSYWEEFRRPNLERLVPPTGLRYVYMGDTLGGVADSPILCKDPDAVPLAPLRETPLFTLGLAKLMAAAGEPDRVLCLMCGCKRPHGCHRSRLIGAALIDAGVEVLHIDEREQLVTQEQVARDSSSQPPLF